MRDEFKSRTRRDIGHFGQRWLGGPALRSRKNSDRIRRRARNRLRAATRREFRAVGERCQN